MHIGHYISGFMHAGILSWVLFGAWFAPPSSMPIPAVNVAIVSPSEYLAMVMSDVPPEVTIEAKKIKDSREVFENIPAFPKEELMVSRTSVLAQVADAGEPESQPSKPELKPFPTPEIKKDLPTLSTPSENVFTLLRSPQTFEGSYKAERVAPIAIAPLPSELIADEQTQEAILLQNLQNLSEEIKEAPELKVIKKAEEETAIEIIPDFSENLPMSDEISLRPQARLELPEITVPSPATEELGSNNSREKDTDFNKPSRMVAPDTSLRPQMRPVPETSLVQNDDQRTAFQKTEVRSAINAQLRDAILNLDEQDIVSELTPQQKNAVRTTVKEAIKPYWIVDPGSPASNVNLILRLEFNKNGKVKEESIELISSEGGNEKAVRRALRAAKTAVKRASLKGAFALPEETFDGWKILELEFDPEEMRKR